MYLDIISIESIENLMSFAIMTFNVPMFICKITD